MKRFRFKLSGVLRQREHAERQVQRRVAAAEAHRLSLESRLREQQQTIEAEERAFRELGASGRGSSESLRWQVTALAGARAKAQQIAVELAAALKQLDSVRQELSKAAAARRAMELMRERRLAEFARELSRIEDAEADDLTAAMHRRAGEDGVTQ